VAVVRDAHFPGRAPIEAYGNGGFRFAGMSHRGAILCLPSGIHGWKNAPASATIEEDSLMPVFAEAAGIEILLIGTGRDLVPLAPGIKRRCAAERIVVEAMSTGAAVRTYNVLLAEQRAVAAALLAIE
jgi:uncharacterized protein